MTGKIVIRTEGDRVLMVTDLETTEACMVMARVFVSKMRDIGKYEEIQQMLDGLLRIEEERNGRIKAW